MRTALRSLPSAAQACLFSTLSDPLTSPAASLVFDRPFDVARPEVQQSFFGRLLLRVGGYYGADSKRRRGANNLYDAVREQAENAEFYAAMELQRDAFAAVHNVLGLHMWLLIKRLDAEKTKNAQKLAQLVYDQLLHDVELRVHKAGVRVRVNQRLEDLERRFYGRCLAYDRALGAEGKETLTAALLRNVYEEQKEKDRASRQLERYLRREMECLRMTDSEAILQGRIKFTAFS